MSWWEVYVRIINSFSKLGPAITGSSASASLRWSKVDYISAVHTTTSDWSFLMPSSAAWPQDELR